MDIEAYNNHCLAKGEVNETSPFDEKTLVYNVIGKTLTLANTDTFERIHLKFHPATAIQLRELYAEAIPDDHMNKDHRNTVRTDGSIPDKLIYQWIDDSYRLVVGKLSSVERERLELEG